MRLCNLISSSLAPFSSWGTLLPIPTLGRPAVLSQPGVAYYVCLLICEKEGFLYFKQNQESKTLQTTAYSLDFTLSICHT